MASDIVNGRLFVTNVDGLASDNDPAGAVGFAEPTTIIGGIEQPLLAALGTARADARLGTDDRGNLYVLTKGRGEIFRIDAIEAPVPAPGALPVLTVALFGLAAIRRQRRSIPAA